MNMTNEKSSGESDSNNNQMEPAVLNNEDSEITEDQHACAFLNREEGDDGYVDDDNEDSTKTATKGKQLTMTDTGDQGTSRMTNSEALTTKNRAEGSQHDLDDERKEDLYSIHLQESKCPPSQKILKAALVVFLFLVVAGSGLVARITFHILIWHTLPPKESDNATMHTLGGLYQHNCTQCMGSSTPCTGYVESAMIDGTWIWAVFLVITTPYFVTFFSTLFRICFKTNKPLKWTALLVVMIVETCHSVGVSILAFLILPSFDPASASVLYLAVTAIPPLLDMSNMPYTKKDRMTTLELCLALFGLVLQIAGIILIGLYITIGWIFGLYLLCAVLVSIKYWENFITIGNTNILGRMKRNLQEGKTKVTCITSLWKIIVTFLAIIIIFVVRSYHGYLDGFKSLFNSANSELHAVYGRHRNMGEDSSCDNYVPFVVAVINIVCDYICYKAVKTSCSIYSQKVGLSIPIILLPVLTTFTLIGIMFNPDFVKYSSCDVLFSAWCLQSIAGLDEKCLELIIAFVLLYISVVLITRHIWKSNGFRHGETARIFVSPFYCGMFIDMSLMLNRRRHDKEYDEVVYGKDYKDTSQKTDTKRPKLYACCATMWHETANEMTQLLKSLFRLDKRQKLNDMVADNDVENKDEAFDFEAHVFFDDAFEPIKEGEQSPDVNDYVKEFIRVLNVAGSIVHGNMIKLPDEELYRTPYGGRIQWKLPAGNDLIVHLKDKNKIRHKKRWSQVMYMFYILKWKLFKNNKESMIPEAADNTYLLALDGDVDFEPEAVLSLVRRMKKSPLVGAACGRIHPIGSGPMVWYQKFEYAISHWLQKATEHVIGCVLCSPGCFSLFRGSAILNQDVLEKYTTVASEAQHFVQYDQGEDRWLCTLMLKQGWRVEYCAESDSYTFAPEGFYEFYNQRRRWTPSTLANILDLIMDWKLVTRNNQNISFLYICYHMFLFISTLLTPGTIFMIILGAIIVGFESVPPWLALVLNVIPVGIFLLMCLYSSTQRQLQYAAILSSVYVIVMVVVLIGIIKNAIEEGLCSITTIFIIFVAGVFVISAILHPKEFLCLIPGILYFLAIPSMSMILFLYSIGNLHVVSWGTRETKQKSDTENEKSKFVPDREERGFFCSLGNFFSCICCPTNTYSKEDFLYKIMIDKMKGKGYSIEQEDSKKDLVPQQSKKKETSQTKKRESETHYYFNESVKKISTDEDKFWEKTIKKYLKPLEKDEEKEKAIQEELLDLRNRVSLFVFLLNAVLVTVMYSLTQVNAYKDSLTITFTCNGNDVSIVPIAILFTVVFGLLLLLQFLCMIYHRFSTLIHITAGTDIIDSRKTQMENMDFKVAEFLLSPMIVSPPPKSTTISDKRRPFLEKKKSLLFTDNQKPVTRLDEVVKIHMDQLRHLKGGSSRRRIQREVLEKWKKKANIKNGMTPGADDNAGDMRSDDKKSERRRNKVKPLRKEHTEGQSPSYSTFGNSSKTENENDLKEQIESDSNV